MNSLRLSLIVYFLALIALALGGVSALVYQTVSTTLEEKQVTEATLLEQRFQTQCHEARTAFDQSILHKAATLASRARTVLVPHSAISSASRVGVFAMPATRLFTAMTETGANTMRFLIASRYSSEIHIPGADELVDINAERTAEYFQTYRERGMPVQRSATLKDRWLTLSEDVRTQAEMLRGEFDDLEHDGLKLRRVTLKAHVSSRTVFSPWSRVPFNQFPTKGKSGAKQAPAPPPTAPRPFNQPVPTFFIQYASESAPLTEQIDRFEADRDANLVQLEENTRLALVHLRSRLLWIGIFTFAGIVSGGYLLLRLGLAPLARLSDAVSKVSERNFQLQVDTQKLPTELRPIADRLRQSLEQLRQAFDREKHAAADISHELRTPLAALMTTLDVALRKPRSSEEYREILDECRLSGQHMTHLVERLMALARLDAGVDRPCLEPVDVADLAQECADMVRALADERQLTLQTNLAEAVMTSTDAGKVREIMLNLLHNAIAYNRPMGSVAIAVTTLHRQICIEVRDTGIGISRDALPHLFERFFRADPSRHSDSSHCGLGLAIVKSYVELLGGSIAVESSSAGSSFRVFLPLLAPTRPSAAVQQALHAVGS